MESDVAKYQAVVQTGKEWWGIHKCDPATMTELELYGMVTAAFFAGAAYVESGYRRLNQ